MDIRQDDEDLRNSHPIMLAEARYLLEGHKERFKADFRSNTSKTFRSTFTYLEDFCRIKDKSVVDDLRTTLSAADFSEMEIALFGSLFPQSVEEAKLLIPSLTLKDDQSISQAIEKIQRII